MKEKIFLIGLVIAYLILLWVFQPQMFSQRVTGRELSRYDHSQDIPRHVTGRVFLSDSDIHMAAGYLYARGEDPTEYNFQHPPLIKYLYGYSAIFFGNPLYIQIVFGIFLLLGTYMLAEQIADKKTAILASIFLLTDPLFLSVSSQALLDLGLSVFAIFLVYTFLYHEKKWWLHGIILGLFAASKFWATAAFFVIFLLGYTLVTKKKLPFILLIKSAVVAFITFSLVYTQSFIARGGLFNIIFFELKTLKYWFHHSVTSMPFASFIMFLTGYFRTWWDSRAWERTAIWNPLWPVSLVVATWTFWRTKKVIFILPLVYLLYLGVQAPFDRYFLLILPYLYIGLGYSLLVVTKRFFWYNANIKRD